MALAPDASVALGRSQLPPGVKPLTQGAAQPGYPRSQIKLYTGDTSRPGLARSVRDERTAVSLPIPFNATPCTPTMTMTIRLQRPDRPLNTSWPAIAVLLGALANPAHSIASQAAAPRTPNAAAQPPARLLEPQLLELGRHYEFGEGVERDPAQALTLFCKAAALGSAEAGYEIAWLYANGRDGERNDALARRWLSWSAWRGDATAQGLLEYFDARASAADIDCDAEPAARITLKAQPDSDNPADIRRFVHNWANNWSSQDIAAYLGDYSAEFQPGNGLSRQQWRLQRRQRIQAAGAIKLDIDKLRITRHGPHQAEVSFIQHYQARNYQDSVHKRLGLSNNGKGWRINREQVIALIARQ